MPRRFPDPQPGQTLSSGITVIGPSDKRRRGARLWECICPVCARSFLATRDELFTDNKKHRKTSCGCRFRRQTLEPVPGLLLPSGIRLIGPGQKKNGRIQWKAICPGCGKVIERPVRNFMRGVVKSCGCLTSTLQGVQHHFVDYTGQSVNNFYVIRDTGERTKRKCIIWEVCCLPCGKVLKIGSDRIKRTQSCGCVWEQNHFEAMFNKYRRIT